MRDLLIFAAIMAALPFGFRRPFFGLCLFSWLAYMRPQDLTWGFARGFRFSFVAGLIMVAGWFVHESGTRRFWHRDLRTVGMIILVFVAFCSLLLAGESFENEFVTRFFIEFIKIMAVAAFTTGQVDTRKRLRTLLWVIALSLGFYGFKTGLVGVLRGGSVVLRGPGGMLEDNNDFALALVMNLPLLWYLGRAEDKRWIRRGTEVVMALTMCAILLTHSRGGFLSMTATLLWLAWRSRRLVAAAGSMAMLAVLFFLLTPQHVLDRLALIGQGGDEGSAGARLKAWSIALDMIAHNPLIGVGLKNFRYEYPNFNPTHFEGSKEAFVAHNSYLQIWAEGGTISFVIYMTMLASVFIGGRWIRQVAVGRPHLAWADIYARMMEATTVGFMVGSFFLNRGHFDLIYHWFGLFSCLLLIVRRELVLGPEKEVESGGADGHPGEVEVRWKLPPPRLAPRWGR